MTKLLWDQEGQKVYEHGVSRTVLYPTSGVGYGSGVAWNGVTSISVSPEGGEANDQFADNIKYISLMSAETTKLTLEAFTYPDEFAECDGSANLAPGVKIGQQARKPFGLCWSTVKGNDQMGDEYGELIHIAYGCKAAPSERQYQTISDSPEPITFSWELSANPTTVEGHKPTATIVLDTRELGEKATKALKDKLYGTDNSEPTLLTPDEIAKIAKDNPNNSKAAKPGASTSSQVPGA